MQLGFYILIIAPGIAPDSATTVSPAGPPVAFPGFKHSRKNFYTQSFTGAVSKPMYGRGRAFGGKIYTEFVKSVKIPRWLTGKTTRFLGGRVRAVNACFPSR
jgi:hypothetical protein